MVTEIMNGVYFYPLQIIPAAGGKVMHVIKGLDTHLPRFGECYFSTAEDRKPKAWKKHSLMTCNLFVPIGIVKFVFYDDREQSRHHGLIKELVLSDEQYGRLVVQPGIWFGFSGVCNKHDSLILNVASILHDPSESRRLEPDTDQIPYKWTF
jgi:dTDP-4-dehydrorhamnose 3,5-epimerase